jgi:D-beta-D-heptose 7-phosphate kinase / D-beta-D-heptose 1-phosphate adenosyltransferase
MEKVLNKFRRDKEIILVGDFMLDKYIYGNCERISPEAPVPVLKVEKEEDRCGGSASVAMNILALGMSVKCFGVVGDDRNGYSLLSLLRGAGADVSGMVIDPSRPTTVKQRCIGLAQHRHQQQMLRIDKESTEDISADVIDKIYGLLEKDIVNGSVVAIEDYNKGVVVDKLCSDIMKKCDSNGSSAIVDPARFAFSSKYYRYRGAFLVTPNREEACIMWGASNAITTKRLDDHNLSNVDGVAGFINSGYGIKNVLITLDKDGAFLKQGSSIGKIFPVKQRKIYDVSGAGDMVLAMLCCAKKVGADLETCVKLSNIAGGLEVEKFGVFPVTLAEIREEIAQ